MIAFLAISIVVVILAAIFIMGIDCEGAKRAHIEMEQRRAERQLHEIRRTAVQQMLDEARRSL